MTTIERVDYRDRTIVQIVRYPDEDPIPWIAVKAQNATKIRQSFTVIGRWWREFFDVRELI